MPLIQYENWKPKAETVSIVDVANEIIANYEAQGFNLTLRQLYYQFVARALIANTERSYKNLGNTINRARMAGLIDWNSIVDRTRNLRGNNHWGSPAEIVRACADQFRYDLWADQPVRVEVWIEKDALVGVIQEVCERWDISYFACRGYNSQSEQWRSGRRFKRYSNAGQKTVILHLGDHDPSGIDMTDDNQRRLWTFSETTGTKVHRIALNMDQIEQYGPPPNPTKLTDARAPAYVEQFGGDCWELDALEPQVIVDLIETHITELVDMDQWDQDSERQDAARERISQVADDMEVDDD